MRRTAVGLLIVLTTTVAHAEPRPDPILPVRSTNHITRAAFLYPLLFDIRSGSGIAGAGSASFGGGVVAGLTTFGSAVDAASTIRMNETAGCITFEGATANGFEAQLCAADPTADTTFELPVMSAGTRTLAQIASAQTFAGVQTFSSGIGINTDIFLCLASSNQYPCLNFENNQTPDAMSIALSTTSRNLLIVEGGDETFDFAHAQQTNPTLFIHSANQSTSQWMGFAHDGTNATFTRGTGQFQFDTSIRIGSDSGVGRVGAAQIKITDGGTSNFGSLVAGNSTNQVFTAGQAVATDNSTNFLDVTGTMPAVPSAIVKGVEFNITGAGSAALQSEAFRVSFLAGYTGSVNTLALVALNTNAGTASNLAPGGVAGNVGALANSTATTTGANIGASFTASGGNTNVGVVGQSTTAKASATNIGGLFYGRQTTATVTEVGVYAGLNSTVPTFTSAALIADNDDQAVPIALLRDAGGTVWAAQDGGTVSTGTAQFTREFSGNKANITEGSAQVIVRITMPSAGIYGATVFYTVSDSDGTDHVGRSGNIVIQGANKAGTSVCTIAAARDTEAEDGSQIVNAAAAFTLTYTWTNVVNTTSCDLSLNAASSAGANTYDIAYKVILTGSSSAITITAQ